MTTDESLDDRIREQASHWFVECGWRYHDITDATERPQLIDHFKAWLAEDPRHGEMFKEIKTLFGWLDLLRDRRDSNIDN